MTKFIQNSVQYYIDQRGIRVHVIGYDRLGKHVIYKRDDYEHDCTLPVARFRKEFRQVCV